MTGFDPRSADRTSNAAGTDGADFYFRRCPGLGKRRKRQVTDQRGGDPDYPQKSATVLPVYLQSTS